MVDIGRDPHIVWEDEWRFLWEKYGHLCEGDDETAQRSASARCQAMTARIMSTPVHTPQGAAVQLRVAIEEQLDLGLWLADLPAQLDAMSARG